MPTLPRYASLDNMWKGAISSVIDHGETHDSRVGATTELIGWAAHLENPENNCVMNPIRKFSPYYAAAEFLWYMSGDPSADMIRTYAQRYGDFVEPDGTAFGAYGPRIRRRLPDVIQTLKNSPRSRQAVLMIWEPEVLNKAVVENTTPDIPCTVSLQFFLRGNRVHMNTYMRSNDVWLGLPYDVFCFTCLQRVVAKHLRASVGVYTHHVGSLHIYERNREKCHEAMSYQANQDLALMRHGWDYDDSITSMAIAADIERDVRVNNNADAIRRIAVLGDMGHDIVTTCLTRIRPGLACSPKSPVLQHLMQRG